MTPSIQAAPRRRGERGTTLVESLVACAFAAITAIAAMQSTQQLRLHGDLARQRGEALRIGDDALESARSAMASASNPNRELVDETRDVAGTNATYRLRRSVATGRAHDDVTSSVEWNDRAGNAQSLRLDSTIARHDPAYSAALALGAGDPMRALPLARSTSIPTAAVPIGRRLSAWTPGTGAGGSDTVVFDDATGDAVARCSDTAQALRDRDADLSACTRGRWLVAAGTLRFDGPLLAVTAALALDGGRYPADAMCSSDAMMTVRLPADGGALRHASVAVDAVPASIGVASWVDTGERFVAWRCLVTPGDDGAWSAHTVLTPTGWSAGDGPTQRRVCGTGRDAATSWRDIRTSRIDLNLRVAAAGAACPA